MNCRTFHNLLPEYLYRELPLRLRKEFEAHAAVCPKCRRLLEEMEELSVRIFATGPVFSGAEKAGMRRRVMEAVRRDLPVPVPAPNRPRKLTLLRPFLLPAALAAAVLLLVVLRNPSVPSAGPPEVTALAEFSQEVEEEFDLFADVWGEFEELEALFPAESGDGFGTRRGRENSAELVLIPELPAGKIQFPG